MTEAEARVRIGVLTDSDHDPVLGGVELDLLVDRARVADRYGIWPTDTGWTPTWDLYGAAALGWELKAAKAAGRSDVDLGGNLRMARSQVVTQCLEMAKRYSRKVTQSPFLHPRPWERDGSWLGDVEAEWPA